MSLQETTDQIVNYQLALSYSLASSTHDEEIITDAVQHAITEALALLSREQGLDWESIRQFMKETAILSVQKEIKAKDPIMQLKDAFGIGATQEASCNYELVRAKLEKQGDPLFAGIFDYINQGYSLDEIRRQTCLTAGELSDALMHLQKKLAHFNGNSTSEANLSYD